MPEPPQLVASSVRSKNAADMLIRAAGTGPNEGDRRVDVQAVLIYDGGCAFCTRCAQFAEQRWTPGMARAVASQTLDDAALKALGLDREKVNTAAWWIEGQERVSAERAIAGALQSCGRGWRLLGWIITAWPTHWLARLGYLLVARNRHRLSCRRPSK